MKWFLGACIGAVAIISMLTIANSPTGRHVTRWIFYTDVRHASPELYRWGTL